MKHFLILTLLSASILVLHFYIISLFSLVGFNKIGLQLFWKCRRGTILLCQVFTFHCTGAISPDWLFGTISWAALTPNFVEQGTFDLK